ncbi:GNAT family N-acetyltransferase [Winogradskyella sp. 3972H.M.0a.05]|uniref:GNAT family N-acetyltransferase n=1 Tax=Winogradskyella sp. 3972H.M.0a.05 TaxID=2950277 RepID=UPI0033988DB4
MVKPVGEFEISLLDTRRSEDFFMLIDNNRSRLEDFFAGTVSKTKTRLDTEAYCKIIDIRIKEKSYLPYIISDTKTNDYIGLVDIKNIDWSIPKAEVGYFIDHNYEGKGIISKSVKHVIEHISNTYKFKKLLCRAESNNIGSISVALKNEFELEGTIRRDYKTTKGKIVDLNYYGRIF